SRPHQTPHADTACAETPHPPASPLPIAPAPTHAICHRAARRVDSTIHRRAALTPATPQHRPLAQILQHRFATTHMHTTLPTARDSATDKLSPEESSTAHRSDRVRHC